jgi:hypothetical protein
LELLEEKQLVLRVSLGAVLLKHASHAACLEALTPMSRTYQMTEMLKLALGSRRHLAGEPLEWIRYQM